LCEKNLEFKKGRGPCRPKTPKILCLTNEENPGPPPPSLGRRPNNRKTLDLKQQRKKPWTSPLMGSKPWPSSSIGRNPGPPSTIRRNP
jgi:hypothetical protein